MQYAHFHLLCNQKNKQKKRIHPTGMEAPLTIHFMRHLAASKEEVLLSFHSERETDNPEGEHTEFCNLSLFLSSCPSFSSLQILSE